MKPHVHHSVFGVLMLVGIVLIGCTSSPESRETLTIPPTMEPDATPDIRMPGSITFRYPSLYPEGIEYDMKTDQFLISSATEGTIFSVAYDGSLTPFIEDDQIGSTLGLEIDHINNRLLVAASSFTEESGCLSANNDGATLSTYDLETRELIFRVDLARLDPGRPHLANDVAVDSNGIAYVTDTYAALIYRVDTHGNASVLVEDPALDSINGIVAHPDGFLLVGAYPNKLFRVSVEEPELDPVQLSPAVSFDISDGMLLVDEASLAMVAYPNSVILLLRSNDGWKTATLEGESHGHAAGWATTIALRDGDIYTLYSHLDHFQECLAPVDEFSIQRVIFK